MSHHFGEIWSQEELTAIQSRLSNPLSEIRQDPAIIEIINKRGKNAFNTKYYKLLRNNGQPKRKYVRAAQSTPQTVEKQKHELNHCPNCGCNLLAIRAALTM